MYQTRRPTTCNTAISRSAVSIATTSEGTHR